MNMGNVPIEVVTPDFAYSFYVLLAGAIAIAVVGYKFLNFILEKKEAEKQSVIDGYEKKIAETKEELQREISVLRNNMEHEDNEVIKALDQTNKEVARNRKEADERILNERKERESGLNRVDTKHANNVIDLHNKVDKANSSLSDISKDLMLSGQRYDDKIQRILETLLKQKD